jgi:hypothetical protein
MAIVRSAARPALAPLGRDDRGEELGVPGPARGASEGPGLVGHGAEVDRVGVDRLLDVGQVVVAQERDRVAPGVGQVEGQLHQAGRLGDVGGGEDDVAVVAVAAAPGGLEVVALPPGHVEDDEGQLGVAELGQGLLHEREALADRAGPGPDPRRGGTPGHADRLELALGVHADPAQGWEQLGHVLEHLGERRHRVPGEEPAPGGDHPLGNRLGTFE